MIRRITALLCIMTLLMGCAAREPIRESDYSTNNNSSPNVERIPFETKDSNDIKADDSSNPVSSYVDTALDSVQTDPEKTEAEENTKDTEVLVEEYVQKFHNINDPDLLQYIKDSIYSELEASFNNEDYIIEDINTVYISKEYLEEVAYNSKENIYFGYTLSELDRQFDGERYIFTVGDDGTTAVKRFEAYDDTYEKIIKNVSIGTGVILVCVTVSVISGSAGAPVVSAIFMASAKTGSVCALSSGAFGAVIAGVAEGIQSGDMQKALKTGTYAGSEAFKWGAIIGSISGGVDKVITVKNSGQTVSGIPTPRESEIYAQGVYGGNEQVSYIGGQKVDLFTPGATRPDVVRQLGAKIEAIEVKNYDLAAPGRQNQLCSSLLKEISQRVNDLPPGSAQRIVLDTRGRGFSSEVINQTIAKIRQTLMDVYPNIPIDVL